MNRNAIIALIMIVVAIGIFINAGSDMTTFTTFDDAAQKKRIVKVTGNLVKNKPIVYDPIKDPNYLSFYLLDNDGKESKVVINHSKPQDFEKSENIVVTGKMNGDYFQASDMLMKCPSKYKDEEIYVKSK